MVYILAQIYDLFNHQSYKSVVHLNSYSSLSNCQEFGGDRLTIFMHRSRRKPIVEF